jgi:hypothetical protein
MAASLEHRDRKMKTMPAARSFARAGWKTTPFVFG